MTCYVVHYQDRYYAWIASPGDRPQVYAMPDEAAGRRFAERWQAANLLRSPWNEHISRIFLLDPVATTRIIYHAAVLNVADSGIWLACEDSTAEGEPAGDQVCLRDRLSAWRQEQVPGVGPIDRGCSSGSC